MDIEFRRSEDKDAEGINPLVKALVTVSSHEKNEKNGGRKKHLLDRGATVCCHFITKVTYTPPWGGIQVSAEAFSEC